MILHVTRSHVTELKPFKCFILYSFVTDYKSLCHTAAVLVRIPLPGEHSSFKPLR